MDEEGKVKNTQKQSKPKKAQPSYYDKKLKVRVKKCPTRYCDGSVYNTYDELELY